jgi:hypothetical protein
MTPSQIDLFGRELGPDPRVALPSLPPRPLQDGPLNRVQFVIELVGQYATRGGSISQLLQPQWFAALGQPNVFVLPSGEQDWRRLTPSNDGLFDSICLAWNYLTPQGRLSVPSAAHLLQVSESYASQIGRYSVSLTPVQNVDEVAAALQEVSDQLDAGLAISIVAKSGSVAERDLWILCSNLGLSFSPNGTFDWFVPEHPCPVLSVEPYGDRETFSLAAVQEGIKHQGATVTLRVATCPAITVAMDAVFRVADVIAQAINGVIFDDTPRQVGERERKEIRETLDAVTNMLNQAGLPPGSPEALQVFL